MKYLGALSLIYITTYLVSCQAPIYLHNNNGQSENLIKHIILKQIKSSFRSFIKDEYKSDQNFREFQTDRINEWASKVKKKIRSSETVISIGNLDLKEDGKIELDVEKIAHKNKVYKKRIFSSKIRLSGNVGGASIGTKIKFGGSYSISAEIKTKRYEDIRFLIEFVIIF